MKMMKEHQLVSLFIHPIISSFDVCRCIHWLWVHLYSHVTLTILRVMN